MGKYSIRSKASNKGHHHIWDIWMGWWLGPFRIETCIEILYFICFPFWDRFSLFFKMNASSASGEMRHSGNKRMAKTPKPCTPGLVIRWGITAQTSSPLPFILWRVAWGRINSSMVPAHFGDSPEERLHVFVLIQPIPSGHRACTVKFFWPQSPHAALETWLLVS